MNNTYKRYYDEDFEYVHPFSPNGIGVHPDSLFRPTYELEYGEQIDLVFNIQEPFRNYPINILIYDKDYYPVYDTYVLSGEYLQADAEGKVSYTIPVEESKMYFKKGIYYIGLYVTKHPIIVEEDSVITLSSPNQCIMRVL